MTLTGAGSRVQSVPPVTSWHAAVFFQGFMVFFGVMLVVWYFVAGAFPNSITEYLPREEPADLTTTATFLLFALIWLALLYPTWKRKRVGLLGGATFGLLNFVYIILAFATKTLPAPAFSDFILLPMLAFGIIASFQAWRSLKQG